MTLRADNSPKRSPATAVVGLLAEHLVAQWLVDQGWSILQRRWRGRQGEIDLVAYRDTTAIANAPRPLSTAATLSFVEVKARSRGSWDQDGRLSITLKKQAKLWRTAELFLAHYPAFNACSCRFDVALVRCERSPLLRSSANPSPDQAQMNEAIAPNLSAFSPIGLGQPVVLYGYRLTLQDYIPNAFGS